MNLRHLRLPFALLAVSLLAACSHDNTSAAVNAAAPSYLAVARGRVDIEGGLLRLNMPSEGVVDAVAAHEGDHVQKGQVLAQLSTESAQLAISAAQSEQQQARAQIDSLNLRINAAKSHVQRLREAAQAGAGDMQSADDAQETLQQMQGELDNAHAAATMAAQKIDGARYQLSLRSLRAPIGGQIVQRMVQPGASVSPSSGPIFVLLPDEPRIVRAELNESFVDVVHDGMQAEVIDDSGSGMAPLKAHVLRIGEVFGASTLEDDPQVRANTRSVECVLVFDQAVPATLRIGQRVMVRFGAKASTKPS